VIFIFEIAAIVLSPVILFSIYTQWTLNGCVDLSTQSDELIEQAVISYADLVGSLNALSNLGKKLSAVTLEE
jgi:hypothetical protein